MRASRECISIVVQKHWTIKNGTTDDNLAQCHLTILPKGTIVKQIHNQFSKEKEGELWGKTNDEPMNQDRRKMNETRKKAQSTNDDKIQTNPTKIRRRRRQHTFYSKKRSRTNFMRKETAHTTEKYWPNLFLLNHTSLWASRFEYTLTHTTKPKKKRNKRITKRNKNRSHNKGTKLV